MIDPVHLPRATLLVNDAQGRTLIALSCSSYARDLSYQGPGGRWVLWLSGTVILAGTARLAHLLLAGCPLIMGLEVVETAPVDGSGHIVLPSRELRLGEGLVITGLPVTSTPPSPPAQVR